MSNDQLEYHRQQALEVLRGHSGPTPLATLSQELGVSEETAAATMLELVDANRVSITADWRYQIYG